MIVNGLDHHIIDPERRLKDHMISLMMQSKAWTIPKGKGFHMYQTSQSMGFCDLRQTGLVEKVLFPLFPSSGIQIS